MERRKRRAASWAACKRVIAGWPKPGVVALVQELYKLSDENRRFLHTRLLEQLGEYNLEEARRKIDKLVTPSVVYKNAFRHSEIKRVVDQFEKASDDPAGVAGLLVADIESSCETSAIVGDVEEIVDHVYASMDRLHKTLEGLDPTEARPVVEALALVAERWAGKFGYGVSDELEGLAVEWLRRLGTEGPSNEGPPDW